ncbi:MAG TPA: metallophosphoesterase family protein [Gemmatimonadaceae bacterium]
MADHSSRARERGTMTGMPSPPPRRIAVLSDVHGNVLALEAVIADLARRRVDQVINLGDHASGPLWPRETVALLARQPWLQIAGNCDHAIVRRPPAQLGASDRFALERLTGEQREWLAALPPTASAADGDVLAVHGTPTHDDVALVETVEHGRGRLATPSEIAERLAGASAPVVLCGHSHVPRIARVDTTLVVNPGSVGLPAYDGDDPEPHVMESGSPDARYAILERSDRGWSVELIAVPYDHRAAAGQARRNDRPDWELGLSTGYMTPRAANGRAT